MEGIKNWFSSHRIKDQIRLALIGMSAVSAIMLGLFGFLLSKHIIEKNYKEDFTYNLEISDQIVDIQLKNIIENVRNLLTNQEFMNTLSASEDMADGYYNSQQARILEHTLSGIISQDMLIGEMIVINNSGKLYCYTSSTGDSRNYELSNTKDTFWSGAADKAKGKEVFYGSNVLREDGGSYSFSMVKKLIHPKTGAPVGYVIVNIRKKLLEKALGTEQLVRKGQCLMIVNPLEEKDIAYYVGNPEELETIRKEILERDNRRKTYVTAEVTNEITGWKIQSVIKKRQLTKDSNILGITMLLSLLVLSVLGTFIAGLISERIYKPLNKLETVIGLVGEGKRNITEEFDESEIGKIGIKFKEMVNNNLELRERLLSVELKERESELLLLQSQINPHFLYNTLDSLYCMAIIQQMDDMAGMVEALSKTFRLSLNKGNKLVLVEHEIEHIKSYMEVQNYRYNGRFVLNLDVAEELRHVYILKFLLQPFVENAMYHGLEPKIGKGKIEVRGYQENKDIIFQVTDDGVGMEDISKVYQGYGVKNVIERIHLYYGEAYGVKFQSTPGKGTNVTIRIAAAYEMEEILHEESGNC